MPYWSDLTKEQKVETIKEVWTVDSSASEIAADIGKLLKSPPPTRNAVIGVYSRWPNLRETHPLHQFYDRFVPGRGKPKPKPEAETTLMLPVPTPEPVKTEPVILVERRNPEGIKFDKKTRFLTLVHLGYRECKWPVNDAPTTRDPHLFCGLGTEAGAVYCPHHAGRAYNPIRKGK